MRPTRSSERQLTKGDFEVGDVYSVDTAHKVVDYASNEGNPLEQQIWQVNFDGERKQLSAGAGFHEATFAPDGSAFTDKYSTRMKPPEMRLCQMPGSRPPAFSGQDCRVFWQTHALDSYHLRAPEQLEVKAHDGTTLYATLLLPAGPANPATVPLIVNPYGGPHDQAVVNKWQTTCSSMSCSRNMDLPCSTPTIAAWAAAAAPLRRRRIATWPRAA